MVFDEIDEEVESLGRDGNRLPVADEQTLGRIEPKGPEFVGLADPRRGSSWRYSDGAASRPQGPVQGAPILPEPKRRRKSFSYALLKSFQRKNQSVLSRAKRLSRHSRPTDVSRGSFPPATRRCVWDSGLLGYSCV